MTQADTLDALDRLIASLLAAFRPGLAVRELLVAGDMCHVVLTDAEAPAWLGLLSLPDDVAEQLCHAPTAGGLSWLVARLRGVLGE